ncbi:MAG: hypothetical protein IJ228_03855 [Succinivibrio sp.]|nr:hypothetical protein [Succinivibrio sp.]
MNNHTLGPLDRLTMVPLKELQDETQQRKFAELLADHQAHALALMVERIGALWAFTHPEEVYDRRKERCNDSDLKVFANFSELIFLFLLALHGEVGEYSVTADYPPLRAQFAGAVQSGFKRGSELEYEPWPDVQTVALSRAGVVILHTMLNIWQSGDLEGVTEEPEADYAEVCMEITDQDTVNTQLLRVLLAAALASQGRAVRGCAGALLPEIARLCSTPSALKIGAVSQTQSQCVEGRRKGHSTAPGARASGKRGQEEYRLNPQLLKYMELLAEGLRRQQSEGYDDYAADDEDED